MREPSKECTTAVALTWLFYLLDSHPEILAKLRAEIEGVVGDRRPGLADLERLTYRYAYFPFGGGSRQCIGNHFATMEAQLILVSLIPRIRLHRASLQPAVPGAAGTLKPRNGMPMRLERA